MQLLSERPMTQTELSHTLGMTKSAVGYPLKQLLRADLIYISKTETERHSILQKFYSPIASFMIASYE
jgi:DNA-binding transcriptional regulator GbsR (MarR family)